MVVVCLWFQRLKCAKFLSFVVSLLSAMCCQLRNMWYQTPLLLREFSLVPSCQFETRHDDAVSSGTPADQKQRVEKEKEEEE